MNQSAVDEKYRALREGIEEKGCKLVPVPFHWNYTTVPQYVEKFVKFYRNNKGEHNIVIGNSYGAMVAFLSAPEIEPDEIIACSLSPFFKEDKGKTSLEYRLRKFGKRRTEAQDSLSATETASCINQTNTKVILMYGEQEKDLYPYLVKRVLETKSELKNVKLVEAKGAPHSMRDPLYTKAIIDLL